MVGPAFLPPKAPISLVNDPDAEVEETEKELKMPHRSKSVRNRLLEFAGLYKFVVDTLVKRRLTDEAARAKVDHHYYLLTPEVARGATVRFKIRGGQVSFDSPSFKNTKFMINDEYLAVILLMKVRRDPFFLWLLALFSGGALAPAVWDGLASGEAAAGAPTPAVVSKKGRKRPRGSPKKRAAE